MGHPKCSQGSHPEACFCITETLRVELPDTAEWSEIATKMGFEHINDSQTKDNHVWWQGTPTDILLVENNYLLKHPDKIGV